MIYFLPVYFNTHWTMFIMSTMREGDFKETSVISVQMVHMPVQTFYSLVYLDYSNTTLSLW